ncbi:MAG TPA: lipid A deacylase LpxR family protein [Chitinophagaceae bacterium]|nr:lipid A deacylase LpxR family protein [Chitinophagaceae bacterium]
MANYRVPKRKIVLLSFLLSFYTAFSQQKHLKNIFFRLSADNDALVPSDNATDWGYTSGNRVDLFYTSSKRRSNFFTWFNKFAGPDPVTTKGWGMMQMIFAPQKTSLAVPDKNDYPYSGALFAIHTIHSANPVKNISFQSEWVVGVMGPPSFAKQTHLFFHHLIKDPPPMGWDYQLPTDLLLNFNIEAEKLIARNKLASFIGTGQVRGGTMNDGLSAGICVRAGNLKNYFNGLSGQYFPGKEIHASMSVKISANLVLYNALLQGGLFNKRSPVHDKQSPLGTDRKMQHLTSTGEFFFLVSMGKFALSFQLKYVSPELKGYESHSFGNISLCKTL